MPTDDTLRTLRALIPDAAVAQSVPLSELRSRWIDMSQVTLPDPDAPMPPINLTARETYVQAESGIGLLKLYNSSRVDPLARHQSWVDPLADQYYGLVEFGSYEWVDRSADNLPGYYRTVKSPHDDAVVGVLFLPAVLNRVYLCRLFAQVHQGDGPFTFVVRSSSGAEQDFPIADPTARVTPIVVSVEVRERGWHDLYLSLNEPFAWTFNRCEVSKTTTPA